MRSVMCFSKKQEGKIKQSSSVSFIKNMHLCFQIFDFSTCLRHIVLSLFQTVIDETTTAVIRQLSKNMIGEALFSLLNKNGLLVFGVK